MEHAVRLAVPFALAAVALVLLMGLWTCFAAECHRAVVPSSPRAYLSQTLMRWRVVLQYLATRTPYPNANKHPVHISASRASCQP